MKPSATGLPPSTSRLLAAVAGAVGALIPALALRHFTVDDALISARYATHLAQGVGYRFNSSGPVTDGVTPLGWAYLLAPFAANGPLDAWMAAKVIGIVTWTLAAAILGLAVHRVSTRPMRFAPLLLLLTSSPLAAWSAAGMETGLVTALGSLGVCLPSLGWMRTGLACIGIAAAFRPELVPFATVIGITSHTAGTSAPHTPNPSLLGDPEGDTKSYVRAFSWRHAATGALWTLLPFVGVAMTRLIVFGRVSPLSVMAKAPDATLGAKYAVACFLLTGPLALVAPLAWKRLAFFPRALVVACFVHLVAVALAGGDWMPLSRLVVPALPAVILAAAHLASTAKPAVTMIRLGVTLAGILFVTIKIGPTAAQVGTSRVHLIHGFRSVLANSRVVAGLDIGWLGAATDATVVDLAGVTDPTIAVLPGGHTTKRIPATLLDARQVDTLVLLLQEGEPLASPWTASRFDRGVENYLATAPNMAEEFEPVAVSEIPHLRYVVLRRRD